MIPMDDIHMALKKMQLIKDKKWNSSLRAWFLPRDKIKDVVSLFGINIKFITPLNECLETQEDINDSIMSTEGFEGLNCTLYPFQTVGANFATKNKKVLIADLMGLGKTLQALGAFIKMKNKDEVRNMVVICPASVKYQWAKEVLEKTDLTVTVLETPSRMTGKNAIERANNSIAQFDELNKYDICITNYETLLNEPIFNKMMEHNFDVVCYDECHMLKNKDAKRSKKAYKLSQNIKSVIALSGTPLENRPPELYGVFKAIDPTIFPSWSAFASRYIKFIRYGIIAGYRNLPELRNKIQPYIIRRTLEDVAVQMPSKIFSTRVIDMTHDQKMIHEQLYEEIDDALEQLKALQNTLGHLITAGPDGQYNQDNDPEPIKQLKAAIMGRYTFLLEVCDSPELLSLSTSKMSQRYIVKDNSSPKLDALMEIIDQVTGQGDKIIVFTQYTKMIKIIEAKVKDNFKKMKVARIDGSVDAKSRMDQLDMFNTDTNCNVMLLSDAGNFGLNAQVANYLVMFEPPLKPSIYDQRVGRIVRIGSKHDQAFIINLVMKDGWDQQIFTILEKKREFTRTLIDKTSQESVSFSKAADSIQKDMENIIKKRKKKKKK